MTDRELMQQALDALFMFVEYDYQGNPLGGAHFNGHKAIEALRARLAQPEERLFTEAQALDIAQKLFDSAALNAVPIGWVRKKEWVGLTDEDLEFMPSTHRVVAKLAEAKLKEKNSG